MTDRCGLPSASLDHLEDELAGDPAADGRLLQADGDVLRIDVGAEVGHREVRAPEHPGERLRPDPSRAGTQLGHGVETVPAAEGEHVLVADQAALVGDVVPEQRYPVVGREQQRSVAHLEEPAARVVLDQGRQPRLAEQFPARPPAGRPGTGGCRPTAASRCRVPRRRRCRTATPSRSTGSLIPARSPDQVAPLLAEYLPGQHQLDRVPGPVQARGDPGVDHVLDERRIAQQHGLLAVRGEFGDHPQDLGLVVARGDHRDRVALRGQVAACRPACTARPPRCPAGSRPRPGWCARRPRSCRRTPARTGRPPPARRSRNAARSSAARWSRRTPRSCRSRPAAR